MIRILIVEDEPPITRVLAKLIEPHPAFEVAGIEYDGRSAMDRLEAGGIDVVFTDIRMPVMDGLELLEQIYNRFPQILTVILTGYQDFDYAKTAISYHAFDYLLKPLSSGKIEVVLARLEEEYRKKTRDHRRKILQRFLAGEKLEVDEGQTCMAAVICAGALSSVRSELFSPGQAFWSGQDLEAQLEKIAVGKGSFLVFNGAYKAEKVVVTQFLQPDQARRVYQKLFRELTAEGAIPVTLIGHSGPLAMTQVYDAVRKLHETAARHVRLYASQFIWDDVAQLAPPAPQQTGHAFIKQVVDAVCAQDSPRLERALLDLLRSVKGGIPQGEFLQMLEQVISDKRLTVGHESYRSDIAAGDLEDSITNAVDAGGLCADIVALLLTSKSDSKRPMKNTVKEIERYLIANYNKPVTHEMLAARFGFVPSYISKTFRKYKGVSPSEFITRYRISKAKEIMDSRPDVLVRDVAETVGYNNQYYFSKIFKKETGLWPKEYLTEHHAQYRE